MPTKAKIAGFLVATMLTACAKQAVPSGSASSPEPVSVVTADRGTVHPTRVLGGYIAPLQNITITSSLSEPAQEVSAREGDHVVRGQTLAVLSTWDLQAELASDVRAAEQYDADAAKQIAQSAQTIGQSVGSLGEAKATLAQAQQKLRLDELTLQRDEQLLRVQYIAQQDVDSARESVQTDESSVASARAALGAAQITASTNGTMSTGVAGTSIMSARAAAASAWAKADQVRRQMALATITSPVDGVVVNRNLNPGEYAGSRTIFTVQEMRSVYAVLNASASEVDGLRVGQSVSISANSAAGGSYSGRMVAVLGEASPGATNFTAKVLVANRSGRLLSGTVITGTVHLHPVTGTLLPRSAFDTTTETAVALVHNGLVKVQTVHVIAEDANNAVVSGLQGGSQVVANGNAALTDGESVAVR